jgi:hypothetical protein
MKTCKTCGEEKPLTDFPASKKQDGSLSYRPHCYSCKYDKEVLAGRVQDKEYMRSYYYKNKLDFKLKAYRHRDRVEFKVTETIEQYDAIAVMQSSCYYCGKEKADGLDRRDNTKGHSKDNVVPCCEKCNNILGDLPAEAKDLLRDGLKQIYKQGLLEQWTIPTKRNQRKSKHLGAVSG